MQSSENQIITPEVIDEAMKYDAYRALINRQLEKGQTTGSNKSEALVKYSRLNVQRMKRLDKTIELNITLKEKLKNVGEPWLWLVITEGWCGDAAQNVPIINKMAEVSPKIKLRFILRDEHEDIIDQYLTNGGRSIPKLVCLNAETLEEIGTWGPRPGDFQKKAMEWKDDPEINMETWAEKLHMWYAEDQAETIQADFEQLIDEWYKST